MNLNPNCAILYVYCINYRISFLNFNIKKHKDWGLINLNFPTKTPPKKTKKPKAVYSLRMRIYSTGVMVARYRAHAILAREAELQSALII